MIIYTVFVYTIALFLTVGIVLTPIAIPWYIIANRYYVYDYFTEYPQFLTEVFERYGYHRAYYDFAIQLNYPIYCVKREVFLNIKKVFDTYVWYQWNYLLITLFIVLAFSTILGVYRAQKYFTHKRNNISLFSNKPYVTEINFLRDAVERKLLNIQKNNLIEYDQENYKELIIYFKKLAEIDYLTFNFSSLRIMKYHFNDFQKRAAKNNDFEFFPRMDDLNMVFSSFAFQNEKKLKRNVKK